MIRISKNSNEKESYFSSWEYATSLWNLKYRQHSLTRVASCWGYVQIAAQDGQSKLKPVEFDIGYARNIGILIPNEERGQVFEEVQGSLI